jgi:Domain of unknown function (DUF4266)
MRAAWASTFEKEETAMSTQIGSWREGDRGPWCLLGVVAMVLAALSSAGCATLAPQQRAILADPTMQFDAEARHEGPLHHALDNREGSMGGTGVSGGGCGCN